MKRKNYIQFILGLVAVFVTTGVFSNTGKIVGGDEGFVCGFFINSYYCEQANVLDIYKYKEKGLDLYTFTSDVVADDELVSAVGARLKNIVEGFVSFSVDDKNVVKIVMDPAEITEEGVVRVIGTIIKLYEYYPNNYNIIERL